MIMIMMEQEDPPESICIGKSFSLKMLVTFQCVCCAYGKKLRLENVAPNVLTTAVNALSMYLVSIKNVLFNLFILILIYISQYIFLCSWGQCVLITVLIHLGIETRGSSLYLSDRLLITLLLFGERFSSTEKIRNQNASNHNDFVYFTIPTMTNLFVILKITFL
jgi:hypothetical protein